MKTVPLFPHRLRILGLVLLIPALALGISTTFFEFSFDFLNIANTPSKEIDLGDHNLTNEIAAISLIISLLLIAFSKEKIEDEAISHFRLEALQWAVYANYFILVLCIIFINGGSFFSALVYNMFTTLIIFILRFRYVLYQSKKSLA